MYRSGNCECGRVVGMSKTHDGDISNAELLEAVNAGFTAMQQQIDTRFGSLEQKVDTLIEENASEHASINRKLDSAITRPDSHDRRLEVLEAVPAFDVEDELKEE